MRLPSDRATRIFVIAVALAVTFTAAVIVLPFVRFAYRSPLFHVALDTSAGLIALLSGYLVFGRFLLTASLRDLMLAASLFVLAIPRVALSALIVLELGRQEDALVWAVAGSRLAGAALLALSALIADRTIVVRRRSAIAGIAAACILPGLLFGGVFGLLGLDPGIPPGLSPISSTRALLVGHPLLLGLQLALMVLYAVAAVGLLKRARDSGDELLLWLSAGAAVLALARFNYFLFPSVYSEWVYTGDILRMGAHVLFLVGAAREIRAYWSRVGELAAAEERRRLARDLHDGIAQELALISGYAQILDKPVPPGARDPRKEIVSASERALAEARSAITALTDRRIEGLDSAVGRAARETARRMNGRVEVDLQDGITVPLAATEMMARVTAEAVTNALRHGGVPSVRVSLRGDKRRAHLRIEDEGTGFDTDEAPGDGFGLLSMRERAEGLGGTFRLTSEPGGGTSVEVVLPLR